MSAPEAEKEVESEPAKGAAPEAVAEPIPEPRASEPTREEEAFFEAGAELEKQPAAPPAFEPIQPGEPPPQARPRPYQPPPEESAPTSVDPEHADPLFFGISASRIRSRVKWGCVILLTSFLLPYDMLGSAPIFAWNVVGEMHMAGRLALLALPLAGLAMAIGLLLTKRGSSLGLVVLASLLGAAVLRKFGADRAAWDLIRVPDAFSTRPAGAILAVALTAAAANLKFRPATRKTVPFVLGASWVAALYFYAWPERGEAPLRTMLRALLVLPDLPDFRYQIGMALIVFLMGWPLVITLCGLSLLKLTPTKDESWFAIVANWSMSLWMILLSTRMLMMPQAGLSFMTYLLTVLVVTVAIVQTSAAVVVVIESFFVPKGDELVARSADIFADDEPKPAPQPKRRIEPKKGAMIAAGVVVVLGLTQFVMARPPKKGTEWKLKMPPPEADEVFGQLFWRWSAARRSWDMSTRLNSGSSARLEVKSAGRDLVEGTKKVDKNLGTAFEELVNESDDLDLGGRKWSRLIEAVNEASRGASLPYYIDPDFVMEDDKGEIRHHFFAHVYKIDRVNQYDVDGDQFATLFVNSLDRNRVEHFRLGFSRDSQPFALIDEDATANKGREYRALVKQGYCTDGIVMNPRLYQGLDKCGRLYTEYAKSREEEIDRAVVDGTERHELQHQIDGPHLPLAGAVLNLLEGYDPSAVERVNRETSAFLAELTTEGMAAKLALLQLTQYLFTSEEQKGVYAKTAVVVFEALGGRTIRRGPYADGERFWPVFEKLWDQSDDKLRARAREVWEEMFDDSLDPPKLK